MKVPPCLLLLLASICYNSLAAQKFNISYADSAFHGPFTGKVIVYLSKESPTPRTAGAGVPKLSCYSIEVKGVTPGKKVTIDSKAVGYPVGLQDLERGDYFVQAVWDRNLGGRSVGTSPGNMYSEPTRIRLTHNLGQSFPIICNRVEPQPSFDSTQYAHELSVPSERLTKFYKRPTSINGAVVLPKEYFEEPDKRFPLLIEISGYGGDYRTGFRDLARPDGSSRLMDSMPVIYVLLDGSCPLGHSEYANSPNNGDWGEALVQDFIPALEQKYRTDGGRMLFGHSSGGWSVLWLQMHYPKVFTAAWSSSPDPVDFRNFCGVDIYTSKNYFVDSLGTLNLGASIAGGIPWVYAKDYNQIENVLYRGEQMRSFDAVFSPMDKNGQPAAGWDYTTGVIDTSIIQHWRNYDISLLLRENPDSFRKAIDNRVRISVGNQDNFFLNHAVRILEKETKTLDMNIEYEYYPGDHFTIFNWKYLDTGFAFLKKRYLNRPAFYTVITNRNQQQ